VAWDGVCVAGAEADSEGPREDAAGRRWRAAFHGTSRAPEVFCVSEFEWRERNAELRLGGLAGLGGGDAAGGPRF